MLSTVPAAQRTLTPDRRQARDPCQEDVCEKNSSHHHTNRSSLRPAPSQLFTIPPRWALAARHVGRILKASGREMVWVGTYRPVRSFEAKAPYKQTDTIRTRSAQAEVSHGQPWWLQSSPGDGVKGGSAQLPGDWDANGVAADALVSKSSSCDGTERASNS